ncbi:MAG: 30S ribosomal protein S13 [Vampirovibrionales bacterium]|jgi:small subunit ribosomal protein S13|nr:30S ribosomal protein S13 [Vampirovibrionales bacterium]
MARLVGIDLPRDKRIEYALPYIYGIGLSAARKILEVTKIDINTRVRDLTEQQIAALRDEIETNYQVEGQLRTIERTNIKRLIDIGCYRGRRHRAGLPVRGQRTHTNARTRRGKRKSAVKVNRK